MSIFKKKKHTKIIDELKRRRKSNDQFCYINSCAPTPYMDGANRQLDELIEFAEKL